METSGRHRGSSPGDDGRKAKRGGCKLRVRAHYKSGRQRTQPGNPETARRCSRLHFRLPVSRTVRRCGSVLFSLIDVFLVVLGLRCWCLAFSLWWLLLSQNTGSRVVAHRLSCFCVCVESLQTRGRNCVPCIASGFLTTGPPGKSPFLLFLNYAVCSTL